MQRMGHSPELSEDLTQQSFIKAWQNISQLRDGRSLDAWLYRIAANVSNGHRRRNKGQEWISIEQADPITDFFPAELVDVQHFLFVRAFDEG